MARMFVVRRPSAQQLEAQLQKQLQDFSDRYSNTGKQRSKILSPVIYHHTTLKSNQKSQNREASTSELIALYASVLSHAPVPTIQAKAESDNLITPAKAGKDKDVLIALPRAEQDSLISQAQWDALKAAGFFVQTDKLIMNDDRCPNHGIAMVDLLDALYAYTIINPVAVANHDSQECAIGLRTYLTEQVQIQSAAASNQDISAIRAYLWNAIKDRNHKGMVYEAVMTFLVRTSENAIQPVPSLEGIKPCTVSTVSGQVVKTIKPNFPRTKEAADNDPAGALNFWMWILKFFKAVSPVERSRPSVFSVNPQVRAEQVQLDSEIRETSPRNRSRAPSPSFGGRGSPSLA